LRGVNDAPGITSPDPHLQLTEAATTGSSALQSKSGSLTFTDPDLSDVGYTISLLGVSASGVIAGLPDAATLLTLLHLNGVTKAAGSSQGVINATFSASEQTFDYLWAGETVTLTYTLQVADSHGGTGTQTFTVTATGTNDGPVINQGPVIASVQEDAGAGSRATGQLTVTDPDLSDTETWTVVGGSTSHAPNYQFKIDQFKVVRTGTNSFTFDDQFDDGLAPPSVPTGSGPIQSYFVTGTVVEQGGKAVLTGSNAGFGTGSPAGDPFFGEYATLNTNISPTDPSGLKQNSSFTISGLFDLILPAEDRNEYGIRLTDRTATQAGDSTVELRVARGADGIVRVQLREIDFASGTRTVLQSFNLNPGSHDKILLTLTHDVIDGQVVHASFQLGTTDESGIHLEAATNFNPEIPATIFSGENWTRAQFFAEAPAESDSVLQGTYGQLDITQAGAWTYQLNNAQALPAEQPPVQDVFTVQVADGSGATDAKTITVNITGTNDAPVAVADTATVKEDTNTGPQPNPVSGNVLTNDTDVDNGDTHSVTKVNNNSANVGQNVAGTYGTLHLNADGSYTYTLDNSKASVQALAEGQQVTDVFTYTNADNHGGSSSATLTVTVKGTNDAPVAMADAASINEDALPNTVNGNVLTNDTDVDSGDLATRTVSALDGATDNGTTLTKVGTYGTLVITKATGGYTYTLANGQANMQALAAGEQVTDVFTYTNSDGHGGSSQSTLTVTVTGVNDAPTIAAGSTVTADITAAQDTAAPLTSLAASYLTASHDLINGLGGSSGFGETDLDPGDDNSTPSPGVNITTVFGATGLNFFGNPYTSLYINNNGNLTFNAPSSTFTPLVINAGLNNPIIAPFWADVDTRGTAGSATPGGHSTGANRVHYDLDSVNGVVTVTWDDVGYYSSHTNPLNAFQVQLINVGNGDFNIVFRYEDINWTTGDASGGVGGLGGTPARAGYSAGDNNAAHYFELSQSGNQSQMLALESTAGNTGIAGVDVFQVRSGNVVSDLTASGTIQFSDVDLLDGHSVSISLLSAVRSGNGVIPSATQSDLAQALTTSMAAPNGHDSTGTGAGAISWSFNLAHGDADFLAQDETLTATYNVTINDGHGGTVTQPVTVTITGTNGTPVAVADVAAVTEDAASNLVVGNLLNNDTDLDTNDTHTVSALTGGTDNGTTLTKVGTYGTLVITKATGAYTYTLANGQANVQALADGQQVTDVFTYTNSDNHSGSNSSTLTVTVTGSNDAPLAAADVAAVTEDSASNPVTGNLLSNDTDVDSTDSHTVSALTGGTDDGTTLTKVGTYGTLVITKATSAYTYTLANGQANVQVLADGQEVTDVFTYTNSDNHGGSSSSTLTVTVTGTDEESVPETNWIAESNGDWSNADNWSNGVPSATVAAVIAVAYTVSLTSSTAQAYSLTMSAGTLSLNDGTLQAGSINLGSGTSLEGHGTVSGPITNAGLIKSFSSHTLDITGDITGTGGSMEIQNHATLEIDGSVAASQTLTFTGGTGSTGTLVLDHSLTESFSAVISGLDENDYIDLKDLTFTSAADMQAHTSYLDGSTTLQITKLSTSQSLTFTLVGNYTSSTWIFDIDGAGGTKFHDPPAASADATTVANSTSTDLTSTVTAALTTQDGSADQFAFQSDSQSNTLADPTLIASTVPSATDATTSDTTQSSPDDTSATATLADASTTTTTQPATTDATQSGTTTQMASPSVTGSTADSFVFAANFGNVTLSNFDPGTDEIEIDHTVFADFQALLAAAHDDGHGNAVIAADPNDTITLKNVTVAQLVQHQGDFHFT
jgi:VCBS repeat-containing protein